MNGSNAPTTGARDVFRDWFRREASRCSFAPGRVNLIGEHTDYNDGWALPCALDLGTAVAVAPRTDRRVVAVSRGAEGILETAFDLGESLQAEGRGSWSNYLRGVIEAARRSGREVGGVDLAIVGNVPRGAGLSSSASLSVAVAQALFEESADPVTLARWAQWSEHHFAACACGIMDQMTAAIADPGQGLLLDCRSLEVQRVPLPESIAILIVHSGVRRSLAEGEYNLRRQQCEAAATALGVRTLREVDTATLAARGAALDALLLRRARHVVSENSRVLQFVDALGREDWPQIKRCLHDSHLSLRDDFEVSIAAVDRLVEHIDTLVDRLARGRGGVRMTGGGFGGCVVAVLEADAAPAIESSLRDWFRNHGNPSPLILASRGSG